MSERPFTQSDALDALRGVVPPGFSRDIVSFGMVRNLTVVGREVRFGLAVGSRDPAMQEKVAAAAREALVKAGAREVRIERIEPQAASPHAQGPTSVFQRKAIPGVRRAIAVASGKGGVGKSTIAVNIAAALHARGERVGLMDADIYGPSIPLMMGAPEPPQLSRGTAGILPLERYGIKIISIGFFIEPEKALIWRGPMVMKAVQQFLEDVEWGALDTLVIDLPPGTGDAQLTLVQLVPLSGAIVVTTPQEVALIDARKAVNMFQETGCPILGIVENMSRFLCPHCGKGTDIFSRGGGEEEARRLGVPYLGEIPIDPSLREGSDNGAPIVFAHPESAVTKAFVAMADRIVGSLGELEPGPGPPEGSPTGEGKAGGISRLIPFRKRG